MATKSKSGKKSTSLKKVALKRQDLYVIIAVLVVLVLVAVILSLYFTGNLSSILDKLQPEETPAQTEPADNTPTKPVSGNTNASQRGVSVGTIDKEPITIHFVYVGQGDAIILDLPNDEYMLIDAGSTKKPPESTKSAKQIYLEYLDDVVDGNVIDYMLVTHADQDHVSMMSDVLDNYEVKNIYYNQIADNDYISVSNLYKTFMSKARAEEGANVYAIDDPSDRTYTFSVGECDFTVFSPGNDGFTTTDARIKNGMSIITLLSYGGRKILFTGDATSEEEEWFIEYTADQDMDVDFVKIAHHGSETSNTSAFFTYITAEYGIICVGEGNSYGLPKDSALQRIENAGITCYRTDYEGTIILTLDSDGDFLFAFPDKNAEE